MTKKIIKDIKYSLQYRFILFFTAGITVSLLLGKLTSEIIGTNNSFVFTGSEVAYLFQIFTIVFFVSLLSYLYIYTLKTVKTSLRYSIIHLLSACGLFFYGSIYSFDYKTIIILQAIYTIVFIFNIYETFRVHRKSSKIAK